MSELIYWKKSVPNTVVVRKHVLDNQGISINRMNPIIAIKAEELRDFKLANKNFILEGIIMQTEEPDLDWETPNALTDEDINELLKNYLKLKNTLTKLDSVSTLSRILEAARQQEKSKKITTLIKNRLDEVSDEVLFPNEMQGVQ